jgi:hypothetical protein
MTGLWTLVAGYKHYALPILLAIVLTKLWRRHAQREASGTHFSGNSIANTQLTQTDRATIRRRARLYAVDAMGCTLAFRPWLNRQGFSLRKETTAHAFLRNCGGKISQNVGTERSRHSFHWHH